MKWMTDQMRRVNSGVVGPSMGDWAGTVWIQFGHEVSFLTRRAKEILAAGVFDAAGRILCGIENQGVASAEGNFFCAARHPEALDFLKKLSASERVEQLCAHHAFRY